MPKLITPAVALGFPSTAATSAELLRNILAESKPNSHVEETSASSRDGFFGLRQGTRPLYDDLDYYSVGAARHGQKGP
jgi:hypothetical protein